MKRIRSHQMAKYSIMLTFQSNKANLIKYITYFSNNISNSISLMFYINLPITKVQNIQQTTGGHTLFKIQFMSSSDALSIIFQMKSSPGEGLDMNQAKLFFHLQELLSY